MQYQTNIMRHWTKSTDTPVSIAVLLFDKFSNLCLANCLEPMRAANSLAGKQVYQWRFLTMDGQSVQSSSGLPILPEASIAALTRCDYLFVVASYDHLLHDTRNTRRALRRAAALAQTVVGLDTGPWLLASAQLLTGRRATVHWDVLDSFAETFLDVEPVRERVTKDGPCITCAGALSALDLSLDLIADHMGEAMRHEIGHLFIQKDLPEPLGVGKLSSAIAHRAMRMMRDNLETPLTIAEIATRLGVPQKTLERRCKSAFGAPPSKIYHQLRLSHARQLLESTNLSVAEVAIRSGYEDPTSLTRAITNLYGNSPRNLR